MKTLKCSECGRLVGASPDRYAKWQIRLGENPGMLYRCRECRKKHPKQMLVTIPDELVKRTAEVGLKEIQDVIQIIHRYQIVKEISKVSKVSKVK